MPIHPQGLGHVRSVESSVMAGAAAMLQLRLLEVYLALPSAAAFTKEHEALVKLCSRSLHGSTLAHRPGEALMLQNFICGAASACCTQNVAENCVTDSILHTEFYILYAVTLYIVD